MWDLNPRKTFGSKGFQDRRFQSLTHSSGFNSTVSPELTANLLARRLEFEPLHFGAGRVVDRTLTIQPPRKYYIGVESTARWLNARARCAIASSGIRQQ